MSALPVIEEKIAESTVPVIPGMRPAFEDSHEAVVSRLSKGNRLFRVYSAADGFDILEDIDRIADYCLEPNIFFSPRFCVPAMPRLDERQVRLMVLQDADGTSAETRFLMPFTVEKPGFAIGPDLIRAWSNPYGPYGAPLIERRESLRVIEDLLATLAMPSVKLPKIIAFPDVMHDSTIVSLVRTVAISNGLPFAMTKPVPRAVLDATQDADTYLDDAIASHHRRNINRQWRLLEKEGGLDYDIARSAADIRTAMEEFLLLENAGWKGRQRTSLAADRYRAAFAREAINSLAERDKVRIHALKLDGRVIASLIVFVEQSHAWTWKTTFDESLARFSPGALLMARVTETLLDDFNISFADSCALPDHPIMDRYWKERRDMVTIVVGLDPAKDRDVRQAAAQIDLYRTTRNTAKNVQSRLRTMIGKR